MLCPVIVNSEQLNLTVCTCLCKLIGLFTGSLQGYKAQFKKDCIFS